MKSVATVNGKPISFSLFELKLDEFLKDLEEYEDEEEEEDKKPLTDIELYEIKSDVLDSMIDNELIVQFAAKNKIFLTSDEINNEYQRVLDLYETPEAFEKALLELGVSQDEMMEDIKNNLIIQKVVDKEIKPFIEKINDNTLSAFYEEQKDNFKAGPAIHAKHIFIKVNDFENAAETSAIKSKIESIHRKLVDGASFEELAKEFSDCGSAERGGDLGIITYDEIDDDFAEIIFNLKKGDFSEPFATEEGFHIALAVDTIEDYIPPFEQVKSHLREYMEQILEDDAIDTFMDKLREDAKIEIFEY